MRTPRHEYAHVVVGANNDTLPPPFSPATFRRYVRSAWLCEGAAAYLAGQVPLMRAAITRRLREGRRPQFPPASRDALVLGGTVFEMLAREQGPEACAELARAPDTRSPRRVDRGRVRAARARASSATGPATWPRSRRPERRSASSTWSSAATTRSSNCVPAPAISSARASASDIAAR